jgi:hypothetical protein
VSPRQTVCRAIEPDLMSVAAGEAGSAAAARVETHVGSCRPCRDELACYRTLEGTIDSLRRAPLADYEAREQLRRPRQAVGWRPARKALPTGLRTLDHVKRTSRTAASGRFRGASRMHLKHTRG